MRNLGNIRLSLLNDRYSIQFKYSSPRKIDFFELLVMEIIKHSGNFPGQTIEQVLLMLEIPDNLHFFFRERLKELIGNNAQMVKLKGGVSDDSEILSYEAMSFSLTQLGEEAFTSKEIVETAEAVSDEYLYESTANDLRKVPENKQQDENNAVVLNMCTLDQSAAEETFTKIIMKNPRKFISTVSGDVKIFELAAAHTGTASIMDNITVSIDNGKIKYSNNNEKILKAFLNAPPHEKQQLKSMQIFNYLNTTQTKVNFEKARLAAKRRQPVKMKVVFGEAEAIKLLVETEHEYPINSGDLDKLRKEHNFCFAGIDDLDRPLVYNYCEITEAGYTIPLEEEDHSPQSYNKIFKAAFNYINQIEFAILAAPKEQKTSFALEIIRNDLSKGKIDAGKVIDIMKEHSLPAEDVIRLLADNAPKTDEIINALLAVNEAATRRIYELGKMYNSLLKSGKLSEISHNTNLYASFVEYDRQFKKLQKMGLKNYYDYDTPKDWDAFMNEVYIFKDKFERIRQNLDADTAKQAVDFFERIQDDYDELAPVNDKAIKQLLGKDMEKEIHKSGYDTVMIASAIRYKYEEYFRAQEKVKDPKADRSRKGRSLIKFTVDKKLENETYRHWHNLCILVHKATAGNQSLWKGNDQNRQKALNEALIFFNKNFAAKEERDEPSNKGAS